MESSSTLGRPFVRSFAFMPSDLLHVSVQEERERERERARLSWLGLACPKRCLLAAQVVCALFQTAEGIKHEATSKTANNTALCLHCICEFATKTNHKIV